MLQRVNYINFTLVTEYFLTLQASVHLSGSVPGNWCQDKNKTERSVHFDEYIWEKL